jgi:hypothetical protein
MRLHKPARKQSVQVEADQQPLFTKKAAAFSLDSAHVYIRVDSGQSDSSMIGVLLQNVLCNGSSQMW